MPPTWLDPALLGLDVDGAERHDGHDGKCRQEFVRNPLAHHARKS